MSWLFTQPFVWAQIKENIKVPCHWPLCKGPVMRKRFPFDDITMNGEKQVDLEPICYNDPESLHLLKSCFDHQLQHYIDGLTHWGQDKIAAIFQTTFSNALNENVWISIEIPLTFLPKGPINNIPALVQIMAWHRPGDKPLSEPVMVSLAMLICVNWPQ